MPRAADRPISASRNVGFWADVSRLAALSKPDHAPDVGRRLALLAQFAQRGRLVDLDSLLPLGIEDQPVMVIERRGRPSSACSTRCTLVAC
jgi:hypothetical protein